MLSGTSALFRFMRYLQKAFRLGEEMKLIPQIRRTPCCGFPIKYKQISMMSPQIPRCKITMMNAAGNQRDSELSSGDSQSFAGHPLPPRSHARCDTFPGLSRSMDKSLSRQDSCAATVQTRQKFLVKLRELNRSSCSLEWSFK